MALVLYHWQLNDLDEEMCNPTGTICSKLSFYTSQLWSEIKGRTVLQWPPYNKSPPMFCFLSPISLMLLFDVRFNDTGNHFKYGTSALELMSHDQHQQQIAYTHNMIVEHDIAISQPLQAP